VLTINLTVLQNTSATISETACDSYTSPSGAVYTSSQTVMDTILNSAGCDSIITINITVNQSTTAAISETACDRIKVDGIPRALAAAQ
jgi:hypothetical protein